MRKSYSLESIAMGVGIGLLATILLPVLKKQIRPATGAVATGATALTQGVRKWYEVTKEEIQDIVAEAQFERMKRSLDQEISEEEPHYPLM